MSKSKHIDVICLVAVILSLLLTIAFMNGESLGLKAMADEDDSDEMFSANDLNSDWETDGATKITLSGDSADVHGNGVYADKSGVHIVYAGKYVVSGELSDGSIIVDADGDDKVWIMLDGASLSCSDSAAIRVEQAKKVFLTLNKGTENSISCGNAFSDDAISNGIDGAIYSRDDLTINGSGSLTVNGNYRHGIVCNDDLRVAGGNIVIKAAEDGIHANDSACFADMELEINAGDDGVTVSNDENTSYIYVKSGNISIPSCYEGLEALSVTVAGGNIRINPTDDGLNANGRGDNSVIRITGGNVEILNSEGRDADGFDSNGSIFIEGGSIFISLNGSGSNCALDYGSENGGVCEISGGTVIACGSSQMAETVSGTSSQCAVMYNLASAEAGSHVELTDDSGKVIISADVPNYFSSVVLSSPELEIGKKYTLNIGDTSEEITLDDTSTVFGNAGSGMPGMPGGTGMPDRQGGFNNRPAPGNMDGNRGGKGNSGGFNASPKDTEGSVNDQAGYGMAEASGDINALSFDDGDMGQSAVLLAYGDRDTQYGGYFGNMEPPSGGDFGGMSPPTDGGMGRGGQPPQMPGGFGRPGSADGEGTEDIPSDWYGEFPQQDGYGDYYGDGFGDGYGDNYGDYYGDYYGDSFGDGYAEDFGNMPYDGFENRPDDRNGAADRYGDMPTDGNSVFTQPDTEQEGSGNAGDGWEREPDGTFPEMGREDRSDGQGGKMPDGQFGGGFRENEDVKTDTQSGTSLADISADKWILLAVSLAVLIAGICIAVIFKH